MGYDTIGVVRTASDTQIKKSFRSLAVRYHPDKNKSFGNKRHSVLYLTIHLRVTSSMICDSN
uniref:DnaJ homolog subfamily B member 9 n=1 Tax=Xiphophorus couchianus TaxID=32473 RepID=A0A3B5MMH6_9TELE